MRSKWHTLAVAGSLGIFVSWSAAVADDGSPEASRRPTETRGAAQSSPGNSSPGADAEVRRLAQELLRQAMVEMDGNRFETARRLARRAAAVGVTVGFVGVHPEQVLAEIDRRERATAVVIPAASADSRRSQKARAIELLDHGLLALDEKRFDDAEQFARRAAQLPVAWDKYDYRPQNLLDEIRRQRPSVANEREERPASNSTFDARPSAKTQALSPTEWADRTSVPSPSSDPSRTKEAVVQTVSQRPVAPVEAGAARRSPAEALLQQAMDDLRAGRDELARHRIEQALGAVPGAPQAAALASFSDYAAANSSRPGIGPTGVAPSRPGYSPSMSNQVFFPIRREQSTVVPASAGADIALKPIHDPYLGDDATTTDKSSAGAQSMRESLPVPAAVNSTYLTNVGYDAPATPAAPLPPRVQTSPNVPALSPQIGWLEKMSAPIPSQGASGGGPSNVPSAGPPRGFSPAPIAPPISDGQGGTGRMLIPSGTDPAIANSPDQPKPNLFQKFWGAISGE